MSDFALDSFTQKKFSFLIKQKESHKPKTRLSTIESAPVDLYVNRWRNDSNLSNRHIKSSKAQSLYLIRTKPIEWYNFDRNSFIEEQRKEIKKRHLNLGRKGFHDFIAHIVRHLKSVEKAGQPLAQIDVAKSLEHFRHHYTSFNMKPYEHMRNLAYWLQQIAATQPSRDPHVALAEAVIRGLKTTGYKYAKLETRYRIQIIITPTFTDEKFSSDCHAFLKQRETHKQSISIRKTVLRIGFSQNALIQYP